MLGSFRYTASGAEGEVGAADAVEVGIKGGMAGAQLGEDRTFIAAPVSIYAAHPFCRRAGVDGSEFF